MAKLNRFTLLFSVIVALLLVSSNVFVGVNAQETEEAQLQPTMVEEVDPNAQAAVDEATGEPVVLASPAPEKTLQQQVS